MEKSSMEYLLKTLEENTSNADVEQEKILQNILKRNAGTEYLHKFLHGQTNKQLFKENVPIVTYEDINPYIDRIVNGEPPNILTAEPVIEFIQSSGTSGGKPKYIPSTADCSKKRATIPILMNACFISLEKGKGMYLLFTTPELDTPSGLKSLTYTTSGLKGTMFRNILSNYLTTPVDIILSSNRTQIMYCHLLFGLIRRHEVVCIGTNFGSIFPNCIKSLRDFWKEICSNIRAGRLSEWITEPACKTHASSILSEPNPELADLLQLIFENDSWEGIIRKLWPQAKYIDAIVTGSTSQYIGIIDYYTGGLPIVSTNYNSSEACFGINLEPLNKPWDVSYTFLPDKAYFEFIPVDKGSPEQAEKLHFHGVSNDESIEKFDNCNVETVDLVNVKIGQCYEVIVTTLAGLYRYRVEDVLKVTGFHNKSPKFQFVERKNFLLAIHTERISEADLSKAIKDAKLELESHGFLLTAYSSYPDTSSVPGHYVLFWEVKWRESDIDQLELNAKIMERCCSRVEESLDFAYNMYRKLNCIAPLEIRVVKFGAFDELMNFFVSRGTGVLQYKTPSCLKTPEAIEILNSRVVSKFFSYINLS